MEFDFSKHLDQLSSESTEKVPTKWDVWTIFSPELPQRVHFDDRTSLDCWFDRRSGKCVRARKISESGWLPIGFMWPHEQSYKPHPCIIVGGPTHFKNGKVKCTFAFCTSKNKYPNIIVYVGDHEGTKNYAKCFNLWGLSAVFGFTLIKWWRKVENSDQRREVVKMLHQFLRIENPEWGGNYFYYRSRSSFDYGELVIVTNPGTKLILPGIVVGDVAVTGMNNDPSSSDVLFLQLCKYNAKKHPKSGYFLPLPENLEYQYEGERQSVAITEFRLAPTRALRKWSNQKMRFDFDDQFMINLRSHLSFLQK